jgi:hypothetical protein
MNFEEKAIGAFKIYTGAMEAPERGYIASVIVHRVQGEGAPALVFRCQQLHGGYRYATARHALDEAMSAGQKEVAYLTAGAVA